MASGLFYKLKSAGVNAEIASEFAKDMVWSGRFAELHHQFYISAKQAHRLERLAGKVDVIICDSPLFMSTIYTPDDYPESFKDFLRWVSQQYRSLNFLVDRAKPYNPAGRSQSEEESAVIHQRIIALLDEEQLPYERICGNHLGLRAALKIVKHHL